MADPNIIAAALKAKEQPDASSSNSLSTYLFEPSPQAHVPTLPGEVPLSQAQLDIQPELGYGYGSILPMRWELDPATGRPVDDSTELTWPTMAREFGTGLIDLVRGTQTGNVTPEGLQTLMDMGLTSALFRPRPDMASMIAAWHGTPHKFDKFELEKIGTGEGAQAYGHGLYFAGSKGTAKYYRDTLVDPDQVPLHFRGRKVDEIYNDAILERWSDVTKSMTEDQIDDFTTVMGNLSQVNNFDDISYALEHLNPAQMKMYRELVEPELTKPDLGKGSLYRAKLDVEEEDLLDWDKPLSEQSPKVLAAFKRAWAQTFFSGDHPDAKLLRQLHGEQGENLRFEDMQILPNSTAAQAYNTFAANQRGGSDSELKKAASRALNEAGIPGIRYDDAMSRGDKYRVKLSTSKGPYADNTFSTQEQAAVYAREKEAEGFTTEIVDEGTSNYVIFDDKLIEKVPENVDELAQMVTTKHKLEEFSVFENDDAITLSMIKVPKNLQKKGAGTAAMRDLIEYADVKGKQIRLTPNTRDNIHGTTSRSRLVKFYKNLGFVENKGRNKDFSFKDNMFKNPDSTGPES